MKTRIILLITLVCGALCSCYEDDSSLNYKLINPIVIDMGGAETSYSVFAYKELEIKPIVYKEGIDDSNLSYKWTLSGNTIIPEVLDTTMTLKKVITAKPESLPYNLLFQVVDKTTGIVQEATFKVTVLSPFGSGLVVCDTRDEQTSDVSLIMAYNFTGNYKKENDTIMYDLFSLVNDRKIAGVATSVRSTIYGINRSLTIGTDHTIDRVDPFDYSYIDGNGSMFVIDPGKYNVSTIGYEPNSGYELLAITGKIYPRGMQKNNKVYSYYLLTTDLSDYYIKKFYRSDWDNALGFDEKNGRLLEFDLASKLNVFNSNKLTSAEPFDWNKLQGFTCRTMFSGDNNQMHTILQEKDEATGEPKPNGKIYSYITKRVPWYDANAGQNGWPLKVNDLSSLPGIETAQFFDGSETQDVIYYASSNSIYSVNLAVDPVIVTKQYEAPDNEVITSMMIWKKYQGKVDYTNPNPSSDTPVLSTSSSNRMLVLTTWNETKKEGTVRTVAIATVGTGTLEKDTKKHGAFGGFGRITAINIQDAF